MENIKVSVIIPVYNAGNGFIKCIESLVNQTLKEIELLFILDCPTDGSDKIIKKYSLVDSRIKIIENTINLHIGKTRNVGLNFAKGEYIAFCDHDDIVELNMYEDMYNLGHKEDADIVLGVPRYIYKNDITEDYFYPEECNIKETLFSLIIGQNNDDEKWSFYFSHGVIWDKLYRKSMIDNNKICFVDNRKITYEDNLFLIETLFHSKKVSIHNQVVYNHIIGTNNTASTYFYSSYNLVINYIEYLNNFLKKNNIFNKYKIRFYNSIAHL